MKDKVVLITGGTGGIGKQTALALAKMGAQVVITGRSTTSGETAVAEMIQASGNANIELLLGDLATRAGVRGVAEQFRKKYGWLDVLINNAGLAAPQRYLTEDGIEADFAVNVLAPYLLTKLLLDSLKSSPAARVINLTGGQHPSKIELDNLQAERSFTGLGTYSHAKLVMMAVMYDFALRLKEKSLTVNVCYPGQASTAMTQNVTAEMFPAAARLIWPVFKLAVRPDRGKSAVKASASSVYLATSAEVEGQTGKYYDAKCRETAWPPAVLETGKRQQLWEILEKLDDVTGRQS